MNYIISIGAAAAATSVLSLLCFHSPRQYNTRTYADYKTHWSNLEESFVMWSPLASATHTPTHPSLGYARVVLSALRCNVLIFVFFLPHSRRHHPLWLCWNNNNFAFEIYEFLLFAPLHWWAYSHFVFRFTSRQPHTNTSHRILRAIPETWSACVGVELVFCRNNLNLVFWWREHRENGKE